MAGTKTSPEAQKYFKEVFKKLKAKQQMATMKQAAQKKEKNKPSAESAAPAPPAAPEQKANKSEAATVQPAKPRSAATPPDRDMIRLRRCVQALEVAVTEGKENRCKRCVADLECEDPAKLATVLDKGIRQRLLWIAGTEVGNVDTLRYLSKLFGVQWEAEVFEARGKGMKTLLGGALERKQFKVAAAVLGGLKATSMGTETLKKAALDSLKVETAPLTTAIHRGAPMGLVSLILDGYSKLMRTCNERSPSDLTPLGASLQQSDTKALELIIGKTDVLMKFSAPEFSSVSPLYYAVFVRNLRKVSILLDAAAGVGLSSEEMTNFLEGKIQLSTPLFLAVKEQYNEIALKLMQAGASFMGTGSSGMTVLHLAVTESKNDSPSDILKAMIRQVPPDSRPGILNSTVDTEGNTVLHCSVELLYPRLSRYLMVQGASILTVNHSLRSPLMLALEKQAEGHQALDCLLDKVSEEWNCGMLQSMFVMGMGKEDHVRVNQWLQQHAETIIEPVKNDSQALNQVVQGALSNNNPLLLEFLMSLEGFTAEGLQLHTLIQGKDTPLALIEMLTRLGANVNAPDPVTGQTLLHLAVLEGDVEICTHLCNMGTIVTACDNEGETPLHIAARLESNFERRRDLMCDLLARRDISVTLIRNKDGNLASYYGKNQATKRFLQSKERIAKGKAMSQAVAKPEVDAKVEEEAAAADDAMTSQEGPEEEEDENALFSKKETPAARKQRIERILTDLSLNPEATLFDPKAAHKPKIVSSIPETGRASDQSAIIHRAVSNVVLPLKNEHEYVDGNKNLREDDKLEEATDVVGVEDDDVGEPSSIEDMLQKMSEESEWEFAITREARQEWAQMDEPYRSHVLRRLLRIGEGLWLQDGNTTCIKANKSLNLELWRTKFSKSGRIVFEVAVDYSERLKVWRENLRLWVITLDHDRYESRVEEIEASHRRAKHVNLKVKLEEDGVRPVSRLPMDKQRLPRIYHERNKERTVDALVEAEAKAEKSEPAELVEHTPAASSKQDNYTLLKFYRVSQTLLQTVIQGMDDGEVDFPFRLSPKEQEVIEMHPDPPHSILLLGRSGTGKTTCAVYRIWGHWVAHHGIGRSKPYHQVFLTASATLKEQVARAFRKLQAAAFASSPAELAEYIEASHGEYATLNQVPEAAYPLFLTTKTFLQMLDGTLSTPFFPRRENGSILSNMDDLDTDGTSIEIALDYGGQEDLFGDEFDDGASLMSSMQNVLPESTSRGKREITYQYFTNTMWKKITKDREDKEMKPSLIYQEIMSYIKGSSEALRSPSLYLSLEDYLSIGQKRAPNFSNDERCKVYPIFERYQQFRTQNGRFDNMDLVAHIFRSIATEGYKGPVIDSLYRDEVQDFTQAELLLDMRCVVDANSLFYCGDTCQTIARGIGFRFADIRTLIYEEAQQQKELEKDSNSQWGRVGMPSIEHLKVNYRTHSGIIDVASSIVDLMKRFFPRHIDHLARERAFFNGPPPLLLSSLSVDDISILLSGSDRNTSQVEFGAHQVILVRSMESFHQLPRELQESRAIIMTVSQSKGLEFDDVFLVDFFHDSPAEAEWRLLMSFMEEIETAEEEPRKLPSGKLLEDVEEDTLLPPGALRSLQFSENKHVLLCEELKHLYTAITRAKNNVVIFDQNPTKRAPFYHYLRRCGLARDVRQSLLVDGADAAVFGLTKGNSSAEEWRKRADNLFDNSLFDLASKSYNTAGDPVRALMSKAMAAVAYAHNETSGNITAASKAATREALSKAACDFVTAVAQASKAPHPVERREKEKWLKLAAQAFARAGESAMASQIMVAFGKHDVACRLLARSGLTQRAAECAVKAAEKSAAEGQPEQASKWRVEAFLQLFNAKDYATAVDLLKEHPELRERLPQQAEKCVQVQLINLHHRGKREAALEISRLIASAQERENWLRRFGYWEELSQVMADPLEAAELLAQLGDYAGAAKRLKKSMKTSSVGLVRDRMHGYLLKVGTLEAAKEALALWEGRTCRERGVALLAVAELTAAADASDPTSVGTPAGRSIDMGKTVYRVDESRGAVLDGPLVFCLKHGLEVCTQCKSDFREANDLVAFEAARPPPTLSPAAREEQLKLLRAAEAQFTAVDDMIGGLYALQRIAGVAAAAEGDTSFDLDPDVPGCSATLESILAHTSKLSNLVRSLNSSQKTAVLAPVEAHFQLPGLASATSGASELKYRRDNAAMERVMPQQQQLASAVGVEMKQEEGLSRREPQEMLLKVKNGAVRTSIAIDLACSTVEALLHLVEVNLLGARGMLREQDCYSVPVKGSMLTAQHDHQLNALLQAWVAITTASTLLNNLGRDRRVRNQDIAIVRQRVVRALVDAMYPPLLIDTAANRVTTLISYSQKTFTNAVNIQRLLPEVSLEMWQSAKWHDRVQDPNLAMTLWRVSRQTFLHNQERTPLKSRLCHQRMVKGERKCFEAAWAEMRPPLWMYGRHMSLAGLLWTASDQLRLTKAEKGVETVLRFMQHCLQGQLISGGQKMRLEPASYLELLELCSSLLLEGIHGRQDRSPPIILPRSFMDSQVTAGLIPHTHGGFKILALWGELADRGQLYPLINQVVHLCCCADLPPMDARLGIDGARKSYLRMRGVMQLGVLAANIMLSLVGSGQSAGGRRRKGLQHGELDGLLTTIQRRMLGIIQEERGSNELVGGIRSLLDAKTVRGVLSALSQLVLMMGTELYECGMNGKCTEFTGWPDKVRRKGDRRSEKDAHFSRLVHWGGLPAAWHSQPGAPIVRTEAPSQWNISKEMQQGERGDTVDISEQREAAVLTIQDFYRSYKRRRMLTTRLRLWSPSFSNSVVAFLSRRKAEKEAERRTAELEAQLEKARSGNHTARFAWVDLTLATLRSQADWAMCPVCAALREALEGAEDAVVVKEVDSEGSEENEDEEWVVGDNGQRLLHQDSAAHGEALRTFEAFHSYYRSDVCDALSGKDALLLKLAAEEEVARRGGNLEREHECMQGAEGLVALSSKLSNALEGLEKRRDWGSHAALLPPLRDAVAAECVKLRKRLHEYREADYAAAQPSEGVGEEEESFSLYDEEEEELMEEGWQEVRRHGARRQGGRGGSGGGGGGRKGNRKGANPKRFRNDRSRR